MARTSTRPCTRRGRVVPVARGSVRGAWMLGVMVAVTVALAACSSDDAPVVAPPVGDVDGTDTDPTNRQRSSDDAADGRDDGHGDGPGDGSGPSDSGDDPDGRDPDGRDPDGLDPDTGDPAQPTLPEIGVPGLDSEIVVCRAWSRFAGSFQVAAVVASFGGDDPLEAARLEVASSPVVTGAVEEMAEHWPESLAVEADSFLDGYVGPYARRQAGALDALVAAGATADDLDRLAATWLDALAARDPAEIVPDLVFDPDLAALVDAAASDWDARAVPIPADPSLIVEVEVPDTQQFLFETCPDRGTLAGSEIVD